MRRGKEVWGRVGTAGRWFVPHDRQLTLRGRTGGSSGLRSRHGRDNNTRDNRTIPPSAKRCGDAGGEVAWFASHDRSTTLRGCRSVSTTLRGWLSVLTTLRGWLSMLTSRRDWVS